MGRSNFDIALGDDRGLLPKGVIDVKVVSDGHVGYIEASRVRFSPAGSPDQTP